MGRMHRHALGALTLCGALLATPGQALAFTGLVIGDSIGAAFGLAEEKAGWRWPRAACRRSGRT